MRRLVAVLLLPLLLAVACSSGGSDSKDQASGGGGDCPVHALDKVTKPVEITFWQSGLSQSLGDAIDTMVANYNASQQKVHVTVQFQGTYDEGADKYLTALRGGGTNLPDLTLLEETRLQLMIDSKSVVPVQDCIDADEYDTSDHLPAVLREFTVGDTLWPMPFNVSNPVLYFDTHDFEKAGLDPANPPKTYDDVLAAAKKIKDAGAAKTGFAFEMSAWYFEQWFAKADQPIVDHDNGRSGRATKATLNNATGKQALTFLRSLFDQGLALNVGRNNSGSDALLALGNGDAGMTLGTSAALSSIYDIQKAGSFTDVGVGVGPLYGPSNPKGGVQVGGGALWMVGKGKSDATKAATWDFMKYLNEPKQQALWSKLTGYIPIRKSAVTLPDVADNWKARPTFKVPYDQLLSSHAKGGPSIGAYKEFRDAIRDGLESLVLKHATPEEALALMEKEANQAISNYNDSIGG